MPPKKSGVRLRQSGAVFVSRAYHAIVGTRVVPPGISPCLIKNLPGFQSCHRYLIKCGGCQHFASKRVVSCCVVMLFN